MKHFSSQETKNQLTGLFADAQVEMQALAGKS